MGVLYRAIPRYPGRAGGRLRGWALLRFRLRLLAAGHPTVASFQRRQGQLAMNITVDNMAGAQTWAAYWLSRRRYRAWG